MKLKTLVLASSAMLAAALMAESAQASTLIQVAEYNAMGTDIKWTGSGLMGTLVGSGKVQFTFDTGPLAGSNLVSEMKLSGKATTAAETVNVPLLPPIKVTEQPVLSGSFTYKYEGPATTINGVMLTTGETLLTGSYSDAVLSGVVNSHQGGFEDDSLIGVVSFTSPFVNLGSVDYYGFDYTFNNTNKAFPTVPGTASLPSFTSGSTGSFSVGMLPEPGTWAMMLFGLLGIGASMRSSKRRGQFDGALTA